MFARRPKLFSPDSQYIDAKINHTIFDDVPYYDEQGISVFAGIPCVSNIADFNARSHCIWFLLKNRFPEDVYAHIDVKSRAVINIEPAGLVQGPLSNEEVMGNISTRYFTWSEIVDTLQTIRRTTKRTHNARWYFDSSYKPIYFALKDD
jgi:hypothetical protein